jgi:hypothetical protein
MAERSGWRRAFDAVERNASPRVEAVIARTRRVANGRVSAFAAGFWHLMNLPAGSDVRRLRMQVGALDREVRRLSLQLDRDSRKPD